MIRWAIAVVVAGQERAIQNLIAEEQQLECWYPVGQTVTKPKNKHKPVNVVYPVFKGYIFVAYHPNKLTSLLHEPKYNSLLGYIMDADRIYPVPGEVVDDIKRREQAGEFDDQLKKMRQRKSFEKGDKVLIKNSVLGNHINNKTGYILERCNQKSEVLVDINGLKLRLSVVFAEKID